MWILAVAILAAIPGNCSCC